MSAAEGPLQGAAELLMQTGQRPFPAVWPVLRDHCPPIARPVPAGAGLGPLPARERGLFPADWTQTLVTASVGAPVGKPFGRPGWMACAQAGAEVSPASPRAFGTAAVFDSLACVLFRQRPRPCHPALAAGHATRSLARTGGIQTHAPHPSRHIQPAIAPGTQCRTRRPWPAARTKVQQRAGAYLFGSSHGRASSDLSFARRDLQGTPSRGAARPTHATPATAQHRPDD